jgi:hypothetical protein
MNVAAQHVEGNHCGAISNSVQLSTLPWMLESVECTATYAPQVSFARRGNILLDSKSVLQSRGPFHPCPTNSLLDVNLKPVFIPVDTMRRLSNLH